MFGLAPLWAWLTGETYAAGAATAESGGYFDTPGAEGPRPDAFDPMGGAPLPSPEQAQHAVNVVAANAGDDTAALVANALEEARLSRKRKILNTVLTVVVVALAVTVAVVIYKALRK